MTPATRPQAGPRAFPDAVPTLIDPSAGLRLRAHEPGDVDAIVEQCRDEATRRWTTVPQPPIGYQRVDAEGYLAMVADGWRTGSELGWAIEVERQGAARFGGSISLRLSTDGSAEVAFGLHPGARGRGAASGALRLVRDYAFDVVGVAVLRWRAKVGHWGSRRVAAAAGFTFDGTVRRLLPERGALVDGWVATMTSDDPRTPAPWFAIPRLTGPSVVLRELTEADLGRVVEACQDRRTQHWLAALPHPYTASDAEEYLEHARELAAGCRGLVWCLADPVTDACLGLVSLEGFGGYARRGEIGYWTHPAARGRGLMTEAVRLVSGHAIERRLVDAIVINCAAENRGSRHVAEAAGFRQVGVIPASEPLGDGTLADLVSYAGP